MSAQQMFAEPQHYWPAENTTQLDRLREQVKEAEASAAKETDWTSKTRAEQDVQSIRRELQSAEFAAKQEVRSSSQQVVAAAARQKEPPVSLIRSVCGTAFLMVRNTTREEPARQQFMPIA